MYEVRYTENNQPKTEKFQTPREAFMFQAELLTSRYRDENGKWNLEPVGVWEV